MKNYQNIGQKFSYFKAPVTQVTTPYKNITLNDVYQVLTRNYFKKQVLKLRSIPDKQQNREYKAASFPFVTFSGTFRYRKEADLIQHSGLMVLDFDYLDNVEAVKLQLLKDTYLDTELLFTSPNGNGLKWVVSVDVSGDFTHGQYFDAIRNYIEKTYQIEVDKSGRDVVRVCFIGWDTDAYLNPRLGKMNRLFPGEIYQVERKPFDPGYWLNKKNSKKDFNPVSFPSGMTGVQHDVEVVLRRIENQKLDLTYDYYDWIKLGFAFADIFGELGRTYFHRVSRFYRVYNSLETDQQFDLCLKSKKSGITIKTFFQAAKDAGINIRV